MQERIKSKKRAVNLSIDAELVALAKEAGINMSSLLEQALRAGLREGLQKKWQAENRDAVRAHNQFIKKHGLLSDDWRKF
jgi:antitoxin CcdA